MFLSKQIKALFLAGLIGLTVPMQAMDPQQPNQGWWNSLTSSISTKKAAIFAGIGAGVAIVVGGTYYFWRRSNLQAARVRAQEAARLREEQERLRQEREAAARAEQERLQREERERREAEEAARQQELEERADAHHQTKLQRKALTGLQAHATEQARLREQERSRQERVEQERLEQEQREAAAHAEQARLQKERHEAAEAARLQELEERANAHITNRIQQTQRSAFNHWQSQTTKKRVQREQEALADAHYQNRLQRNAFSLWHTHAQHESEQFTAAQQQIRTAHGQAAQTIPQHEARDKAREQAIHKIELSQARGAQPRTRRRHPQPAPAQSAMPENPMMAMFRMQNAITSAHTRTFGVNNIFRRELEYVDEWIKVITDIYTHAQENHPSTAYAEPLAACVAINDELIAATTNAYTTLFTTKDRLSEETIAPIQAQLTALAQQTHVLKDIRNRFANGYTEQPAREFEDFTFITKTPEAEKHLEALVHHVALTLECTIEKVCKDYQSNIRTRGVDRADTNTLVANSVYETDIDDIGVEMEILRTYIERESLERILQSDHHETVMAHINRIGLQHMKIHAWLATQLVQTEEIQAIQHEYQSLENNMNHVFSQLVERAHRLQEQEQRDTELQRKRALQEEEIRQRQERYIEQRHAAGALAEHKIDIAARRTGNRQRPNPNSLRNLFRHPFARAHIFELAGDTVTKCIPALHNHHACPDTCAIVSNWIPCTIEEIPTENKRIFTPERFDKKILLIGMHGTYSSPNSFGVKTDREMTQQICNFASLLAATHNAQVELWYPKWSGKLSRPDREQMGAQVAQYINQQRRVHDASTATPDLTQVWTIAHSHGCNVINLAATQTEEPIDVAIHIASPSSDVDSELVRINNVYNFYGTDDVTQAAGSVVSNFSFCRKPLHTTKAMNVHNIRLQENGINLNHDTVKLGVIRSLPWLIAMIDTFYHGYADLDANTFGTGEQLPLISIRHAGQRTNHRLRPAARALSAHQDALFNRIYTRSIHSKHGSTLVATIGNALWLPLGELWAKYVKGDERANTREDERVAAQHYAEAHCTTQEELLSTIEAFITELGAYNPDTNGMNESDKARILSEVTPYLKRCEILREQLFTLLRRTSAENAEEYCKSVTETFVANVRTLEDIEPNQAYAFLGIQDDVGKQMPLEEVRNIINTMKNDADEATSAVLRQIEYIFRNNFSKQEYDAFITSPEDVQALFSEDPTAMNHLLHLLEAKAPLEDLKDRCQN